MVCAPRPSIVLSTIPLLTWKGPVNWAWHGSTTRRAPANAAARILPIMPCSPWSGTRFEGGRASGVRRPAVLEPRVVPIVCRGSGGDICSGAGDAGGHGAADAGNRPHVESEVVVDVALSGGNECRTRWRRHRRSRAGRKVKDGDGLDGAELEQVDDDSGRGRRGEGRRAVAIVAVEIGAAKKIRVTVAALRSESDLGDQRAIPAVLLQERFLQGVERSQVGLHLRLLRPGLQRQEARNRERAQDSNDGDRHHELQQCEASD